MTSRPTERVDLESHPTGGRPLPEFVDWVLAALVALAGLALVVAGSVLVFVVDRGMLADAIESEDVAGPLTEAELLDVAVATVTWTGVGHVVAGAAMALAAVGYVVVRHRAHRQASAGEPVSSYGTNALLGAVVAVVVSFVPFSLALGGAVAGYFERGESERTASVGAVSGLLAVSPVLVVLPFVLVGLVAGMLAIGQAGLAVVVAAALLLALMAVATIGAGIGAVGGFLGGKLAERLV